MRFDVLLWQAVPWAVIRDDVHYLEQSGIGTVWVGDHYAWPPDPPNPVYEAWTTLAACAAVTTRLRLGTLVSNVSTRHPALLAKQAATLDCISGGRLDLGLGPGAFAVEHAWLGIPFLDPAGRLERLAEAVEIIDRLLRERTLNYHGKHYQLAEAPLVPAPVQQPRPPLTIAADGKRALRLVAERADTWVTLGTGGATVAGALATIRERNRLLDEHCAAIGRRPETVERAYFAGWAAEFPFASPDAFEEFVGRYREAGVERFIFTFACAGQFEQAVAAGRCADRSVLERFAAGLMARMQDGHT